MIEENEIKMLEKHFGQKVASEMLNIEGIEKPLPFDIYDGYAVCEDDGNGNRYEMEYPILKCIKDNKEFSDAVIDYVGDVTSVEEITPIHSLLAFNRLYKNGVEILPKETEE